MSNTTAAIVWGCMLAIAGGWIYLGRLRKPEPEEVEERD